MTAIVPVKSFSFGSDILAVFASVKDNYSFHVRAFIDFARLASGKNMLDIIGQYYQSLNGSGFAASTIRCRRQAVKSRLRLIMQHETDRTRSKFEYELGLIDKKIKCPGVASIACRPDKIITAVEYIKLLTKARSERQKRFIEFLYSTGCRISELTGIRLNDCKMQGSVVVITLRGKGNKKQSFKEREIFLSLPALERIKETFAGKEYLFETSNGRRYNRCYITSQLSKLTKKVIGRALGSHCFRHTFATRKIQETGRPKAVSQYIGHSDVNLTLRVYCQDVFSAADVLGSEAILNTER